MARVKWLIILLIGIGLFYLYRTFSPDEQILFPKCPFLTLTGYKCPGCGSQRAVHHLLNFEFTSAFKENALLIISIPYIIFGLVFDRVKNPSDKLLIIRERIMGRRAIWLIFTIIISYWVFRNL